MVAARHLSEGVDLLSGKLHDEDYKSFMPTVESFLAAEGSARKKRLFGLGTIVLASDGWAPVGVRSRPVSRPPLRHSLGAGWSGSTGG
jgi:hypothetical protein